MGEVKHSTQILALDIGTASLGWALVQTDDSQLDGGVLALGVRSFEEPVEPKGREPKNVKRRTARGLRKTLYRRALRKQVLRSLLTKHQMLPESEAAFKDLCGHDPYELRTRGLSEKLTLAELGRALYHLGQRRGFLSNRKSRGLDRTGIAEVDELIELDEQAELSRAKSEKATTEDGVVLAGIASLVEEMEHSRARTLGEHFHRQLSQKQRVRARHTRRDLYQAEFEALWSAQQRHYPEKLTDALKLQIERTIFYQRPLKDQAHLRAKCELEKGNSVVLRAHPDFQEFRIWQDLANIRLKDLQDFSERRLTLEERRVLVDLLQNQPKLTWTQFRTKLKLGKKDALAINIEDGGAKDLVGNVTLYRLTEATGGEWSRWDRPTQNEVIDVLLGAGTDATKLKKLVNDLQVDPKLAYRIMLTTLPEGTGNVSLRAIRKLLPFMRDGVDTYDARLAAGYTPEHEKVLGDRTIIDWIDLPDSLRNPGVSKCLHETRKLVNAITRKYGKPDQIRVELGRDLALPRQARIDISKAQKRLEASNAEAREAALTQGIPHPKRPDLIKYRLHQECQGVCPYTGKTITLETLFGDQWDIEHIIPFSVSLDDSFGNKTLCDAEFNRNVKRNRLPSEVFAGQPEAWNEALRRVNEFKCGRHKKKLFAMERADLPEDFQSRQLNDTRYASLQARDFLEKLGVPVHTSAGKHTAVLRRHWGLHTLLSEDGAKNRDDHRHHAIDAVVIALTTPTYIKRISDLYKSGGSLEHSPHRVPQPWPELRNQVKHLIEDVIVSHEPTHKIRGALHEETGYGRNHEGKMTTRKALVTLTEGEVGRIVDTALRSRLEEHIYNNPGKLDAALETFRVIDAQGESHRVNRVKIYAKGQNLEKYFKTERGFFPAGGNLWLLVMEEPATGKLDARVIPLWRAAQLKHQKLGPAALVPPGWRLLHVLHKNDIVEIGGENPGIYRVVKFSEDPIDITFRKTHDASQSDETKLRFQSPKRLGEIIRRLRVGMIDVS